MIKKTQVCLDPLKTAGIAKKLTESMIRIRAQTCYTVVAIKRL